MSWRYGEKRQYCETCLQAARQEQINRDCMACAWRMPDIDPGIIDAWQCLTLCETQLRAGMSGPYALDWGVVFNVAEARGAEVDSRFIDLLKLFELAMMKELNKK